MKILGIDPGYDRLGVAVIEDNTLLYSDCITTLASAPFSERLLMIGSALQHVVNTYTPEEAAIEKLYFNSNQKTALSVAQAIGVITYIISSSAIPLFEYTPPQIKVACTSNGRADKRQVADMIPLLLSLPPKKRLDDEYDAIAVALTHAAHRG